MTHARLRILAIGALLCRTQWAHLHSQGAEKSFREQKDQCKR